MTSSQPQQEYIITKKDRDEAVTIPLLDHVEDRIKVMILAGIIERSHPHNAFTPEHRFKIVESVPDKNGIVIMAVQERSDGEFTTRDDALMAWRMIQEAIRATRTDILNQLEKRISVIADARDNEFKFDEVIEKIATWGITQLEIIKTYIETSHGKSGIER